MTRILGLMIKDVPPRLETAYNPTIVSVKTREYPYFHGIFQDDPPKRFPTVILNSSCRICLAVPRF